jgi:aminoglycoside phosphotransferase (APT) family kinase protein
MSGTRGHKDRLPLGGCYREHGICGAAIRCQHQLDRESVDGLAQDRGVIAGPPAWDEVAPLLARVLGEQVNGGLPLTPGWSTRMTWAAGGERSGPLVVKVRLDDRAHEKAAWCAAHLPQLAARGYPVPAIIWHGMADDRWHVTVQNRLPGHQLVTLDGWQLAEVLRLVERQADAAIPAEPGFDFTGYIANVLFDDWDRVWAGAARAGEAAALLCVRIRRWLQPVWGLRLPPADYAHNDLNLSNILTGGRNITGVVDWDEFGLGSRALDLITLAFDCQRCGAHAAVGRLLARAASIAGRDGLRCLVAYRAIAWLAAFATEEKPAQAEIETVSAILDRLQAAG